MKIMKKIITILAASVMMLSASNAFAQIAVGAGYLNATDTWKSGKESESGNSSGFYAGISYNIPLAGGLAVASGIYYSGLFSKSDIFSASLFDIDSKVDSKTQEHYINVPVNFNYGFELAPDMTAFIFAGPTLQYGLSSKTTLKESIGKYTDNQEFDNYDEDNHYSKTNVLLGGGIGMNLMDAFQITVGYDYGLINLYTGDGETKRNKSYIKVGVAYLF